VIRSRAATTIGIAMTLFARPALADEPREQITITTDKERLFTGVVEAYVPFERVTIAGRRRPRVIPWQDIACSSRLGWFSEPATPPAARSTIRFSTDGSASLSERRWIATTRPLDLRDKRWKPVGSPLVLECKQEIWVPLCTSDCAIEVGSDRKLRVAGPALDRKDWLFFEPGSGRIQIRARAPSDARQIAGAAMTIAGGAAIVIGSLLRGLTMLTPNETIGDRRDIMHYALFWSGAGLVAAGAPLLAMDATPVQMTREGERAGWPHGSLRGLEIGARFMESFRYQGKNPSPTRDVKPDDGIRRFTAAQIDLGYRILPELYVGAFGAHGLAEVACSDSERCFGRVSRVGATVRGILPIERGRFAFWGGVGAAYEWTSSRVTAREGETRVAYRGPQLFFAETGFDVSPARRLFLGPFVRASFGHYDAVTATTPAEGDRSGSVRHAAALVWFDLGLRGAFTLPFPR
jgi:hypothetical protein